MSRQNLTILSISQLNKKVGDTLQAGFSGIWVSGEISNWTLAASGHAYFLLKDAQAQVRCALFKGRMRSVSFIPKEGMQVEAYVNVSLYAPRGEFQLTVENLRLAGQGDLFVAFEQLKQQLAAEGLFAQARKRPIPLQPRAIGLITSTQAAALRDVCSTLRRRAPHIPIILYPTPVQGLGAAEKIAAMLSIANQRAECDVLILCRGGGSIEDLWSFNEAILAYAIAESQLPVISGVGHETDFTIADFVADCRAATPTAAAELASPERHLLLNKLAAYGTSLTRSVERKINQTRQQLDYMQLRLVSPSRYLLAQRQQLVHQGFRLQQLLQKNMQQKTQALQVQQETLKLLSPERVLQRGYALLRNQAQQPITQLADVKIGEKITLQMADGQLLAEIHAIEWKNN